MNRLLNEVVESPSLDLFTTRFDPDKPHVTLNMLLLEQEVGEELLSNVNYCYSLQLHQSFG